jgi:hypothetical protein
MRKLKEHQPFRKDWFIEAWICEYTPNQYVWGLGIVGVNKYHPLFLQAVDWVIGDCRIRAAHYNPVMLDIDWTTPGNKDWWFFWFDPLDPTNGTALSSSPTYNKERIQAMANILYKKLARIYTL